MRLQTTFQGPGSASLSGTLTQGSASGGTAGVGLACCAPMDVQGRATLHASAAAFPGDVPAVDLEMDDRWRP